MRSLRAFLVILAVPASVAAQDFLALVAVADANRSGSLDELELIALHGKLFTAADADAAEDFAVNALTRTCTADCTSISLDDAADFLRADPGFLVGPADLDGSGKLDRAELIALFGTLPGSSGSPPDSPAARDFADDALTWMCASGCLNITLDEAAAYLRDRAARQRGAQEVALRKVKVGWPGLGFSRFVVDAMNPRPAKFAAPTIFSYARDNEAKNNRDRINVLGGVQLWKLEKDLDRQGLGTIQLTVTPGLDFDVDGSKKANENSIVAGVPIFLLWVIDRGPFESLLFGFKPKFATDRAFDREVAELTLSTSFSAPGVGAGFIRPPKRTARRPTPLSVFWQPALDLELGDVRDAAGNEKLEPLEDQGSYTRVAPRVNLILFPWSISDRLRFTLDYSHRFDLGERWDRGFGEARLDYDLIIDGSLELSAVYRRGRKPPDFARKDEVLVGIGIKQ